MFRVIYGRVFTDVKEAEKAAGQVKELSPQVKAGQGSFVVELGKFGTRQEADSAYFAWRGQGLKVWIQKLKDKKDGADYTG